VDLREEQIDQVTVLEVRGRIDSSTAPVLDARLAGALAEPTRRLLVDFRQIDYISSAGFRVLLLAAKRADQTGSRFVLCGLSAKVRQLFDLGGFLDLFPISASRDEGLAALR
jgi:anti-sigma B factor antagonist